MWVYQREENPSYEVVVRTPAHNGSYVQPIFYNRADAPLPDTDWPTANLGPRLRLLRYRDIDIYPQHVMVDHAANSILPITFKKHRYHRHNGVVRVGETEQFQLRNRALRDKEPRAVPGPLFLGDTEYPGIFGHDLIEVLTAAWAWQHTAPGTLFATSTKPRPYLFDLLGAAGVPRSSLLFFNEPLRVAEALFPESAVLARRYVHPAAFDVFDRVREAFDDSRKVSPERIYISRTRVGERAMANEAELEVLAEANGFTIIHPQELTISEQVNIFSRARFIMGTGGSAMHNAVFARPDARVLLVSPSSWLTVIDSLLDNGRNRLGYVIGDPIDDGQGQSRRHQGPWRVEMADVRDAMRQHFGLPC